MLATAYRTIHKHRIFFYFTWFTRILLALAFLPSGVKKLIGSRFTMLGLDNPVGFFFEALYRTGLYWNFLGLVQLTAATSLLIPRTAFFGAVIYLPIVLNIMVIVCSMHFSGTPIVAGLMLLANLYLLLWDYLKVKQIWILLFQKSQI